MDHYSELFTRLSVFLRYEKARLATFIDWPRPYLLDPKELAADGFYYLRNLDHCACIFCAKVIGAWEYGDELRDEHLHYSPDCKFINGLPVGNIPMSHSDVLEEIYLENQKFPTYIHDASMEIADVYSETDLRISSFYKNLWPDKVEIKPEKLAKAGFFYPYKNFGDHVSCFDCGIGLRNWKLGDNPVDVHARWSPNCRFLQNLMGKAPPKKTISPNPSKGLFKKITEKQLDVLAKSTEIQTVEKEVGILGKSILRTLLKTQIENFGVPFRDCREIRTKLSLRAKPLLEIQNLSNRKRQTSI